jgi:hypothetical protein
VSSGLFRAVADNAGESVADLRASAAEHLRRASEELTEAARLEAMLAIANVATAGTTTTPLRVEKGAAA